jgi:hypothetical protein
LRANLVDLGLLSGYVSLRALVLFLLTRTQIRIVVDTHQDEKPNKKKKKHRGYAFVVYEREKDMRGNAINIPSCPLDTPLPDLDVWYPLYRCPLKLPIISFRVKAQSKVYYVWAT